MKFTRQEYQRIATDSALPLLVRNNHAQGARVNIRRELLRKFNHREIHHRASSGIDRSADPLTYVG